MAGAGLASPSWGVPVASRMDCCWWDGDFATVIRTRVGQLPVLPTNWTGSPVLAVGGPSANQFRQSLFISRGPFARKMAIPMRVGW